MTASFKAMYSVNCDCNLVLQITIEVEKVPSQEKLSAETQKGG